MSEPTLQSIAQELAMFQLNTLKRLDELQKDKMNADVFTEKVYPLLDMRIKALEDARKVQRKLNQGYTEAYENYIIGADYLGDPPSSNYKKPSFFDRLFKRK